MRLLWVVSRTVNSFWPVWPLAKGQIRILVFYQRSHLLELTYSQTRHYDTAGFNQVRHERIEKVHFKGEDVGIRSQMRT